MKGFNLAEELEKVEHMFNKIGRCTAVKKMLIIQETYI